MWPCTGTTLLSNCVPALECILGVCSSLSLSGARKAEERGARQEICRVAGLGDAAAQQTGPWLAVVVHALILSPVRR